jgi:16S rRNA (uracil1498-N3)-methyltransferase
VSVPTEERRWLRSHPLVFVEDLDAPVLDEDDRRHLERSLRLGPGDPVSIGDGAGRWRRARLGHSVEPFGEVIEAEPVAWTITVAFAPVKSHKPEWMAQKLTELGVDHIAVIESDRTVVRWDEDRSRRRMDRMAKTIREAAMQSRQVRLPSFQSTRRLSEFVADHPGAALADPDGSLLEPSDRIVVIGPEGGWSPVERGLAPLRSLPGGVLRAETAGVVAAAMLAQFRR